MQERSQLRHTSVGNGLAILFNPDRAAATLAVLRGTAAAELHPDTRARLAEWQDTRARVLRNLQDLDARYVPFPEALAMLDATEDLAACHRARTSERFELASFVASVRELLAAFDACLQAASQGRATIEDLRRVHRELVNGYDVRRIFPHHRGM